MTQLQILQQENKQLRAQLQDCATLLANCSKQVGLILQEEIAEHVARINGTRFNKADWDMKETNGEQ